MTYISIVCKQGGTIVISKVTSTDDYHHITFYQFNHLQTKTTRFISELHDLIDSYDTEILVVDFVKDSKVRYINQIYGCLKTLHIFGTINKLTFIDNHMKMFTRIARYTQAGKTRKMTRNGIGDLLLDSGSCKFYTNSIDNYISNKTTHQYNQHRTAIIAVFYMIIKNRLSQNG